MKKPLLFLAFALLATSLAAAPKKVLVVTTTAGFRHSSIPTAERILAQLARENGEFTVEFVRQPDGKSTTNGAGAFEDQMKSALQKLSPESLQGYDGVIFASTTGELPIPDKQGFLDWIKAGHAFIGIHAASDTFHGWPGYVDMIGGEFLKHGPQTGVECLNEDPSNPATASLGKSWAIAQEEIYQFTNHFPAKVHELLVLDRNPEDKTPGHFPVAWCKNCGAGKVFYTSLGHREDLWDADPKLADRKNSAETSRAFQAHLLGGIEWALGLKTTAAGP